MEVTFFSEVIGSGAYKWRSAIPARHLRKRGHSVQIRSGTSGWNDAADVAVFFRYHSKAMELVKLCRERGIRIVFDVDDALDLVPREHPYYQGIQTQLASYRYLLSAADAVTTTTPALAEHLAEHNRNVAVIPNSVDAGEWFVLPRNKTIRIGWTGSMPHFRDLPIALDAILDLQRQYDFTFVFQGLCTSNSPEEFHRNYVAMFPGSSFGSSIAQCLQRLAAIKHEFHPLVEIGRHSHKVCDLALDIGIAPLAEDLLTRNKSCIKYYEYAMSGAVTVTSRVPPYTSEVTITAENHYAAWRHQLAWLIEADRPRLWSDQRTWVLDHRNIEATAALWDDVLH